MKKIISAVCMIFAVSVVFLSCGKNEVVKLQTEEQSIYSDDNTVSIYLSDSNYIVCDMSDGICEKSYYVYHYLTEDDAKVVFDSMKNDIPTGYSDIKCDGCFLYMTYDKDNENSLTGLSISQIELIYGDNIVREKGE